MIRPDDVVAVMTPSEAPVARGTEIGPEVDDTELLDFPIEVLDVVVTNKAVVGKTLRELAGPRVVAWRLPAKARAARAADAVRPGYPLRPG